jgi:uncharacterized membrane protein
MEVAVAAQQLPDRVPTHFGVSGDVDGWSSSQAAVPVLTDVGAAMALLFWALASAMPRISLRRVHVPHSERWTSSAERRRQLRSMLCVDSWALGSLVMLTLLAVAVSTLRAADRQPPVLGGGEAALTLLPAAAVVGYGVWMSTGRYRRAP